MDFDREGHTLFCANIDASNTAYLDGKVVSAPQAALSASASALPLDESLWHRRFAHTHLQSIRNLAKGQLVSGMHLDSTQEADPICEPCLSGKLNAAPFPSSTFRASKPLKLDHSDVHGPLPVRTTSGYRYWITFIEDPTRLRSVILLKTKGEATSAFKQFKAFAENETNEHIGTLHDDKGDEYIFKELEDFCNEHGIQRQHTVRNRPQQNGVAERFNRVLTEGITAMLSEAGLPPSFWGEALSALVHVLNRCLTSALPVKTPSRRSMPQARRLPSAHLGLRRLFINPGGADLGLQLLIHHHQCVLRSVSVIEYTSHNNRQATERGPAQGLEAGPEAVDAQQARVEDQQSPPPPTRGCWASSEGETE
ncbi:hypothetical protein PsYK624_173410 [Phanerochaete sordida]|uniref:Integrase catalytic domain-containing protein n=1 Tax=Phanerochaete sordida TaxID=48140 RepID=A0A9P3LPJ3_9APHY|nr:hypothetical protein PsYK624_173410 [Phanerochaete sordida]